jgi:hypothetical protein
MARSLSFAQPLHALQHQVTAASDIPETLLLSYIQVAHWMRQHDMSVVGSIVQGQGSIGVWCHSPSGNAPYTAEAAASFACMQGDAYSCDVFCRLS